jgi:hypothetical protein
MRHGHGLMARERHWKAERGYTCLTRRADNSATSDCDDPTSMTVAPARQVGPIVNLPVIGRTATATLPQIPPALALVAMSPAAAAAARATSFAATFSASTAPSSRGLVRRPFRGPTVPRRAVASMAVSAPRSPAAASFLERRESERALHFVKYQGLGNDFIMVRLALSRFFLFTTSCSVHLGGGTVLRISCSLRCFRSYVCNICLLLLIAAWICRWTTGTRMCRR